MTDLTTFTWVCGSVGILAPIVSWGILIYQNGHKKGEKEAVNIATDQATMTAVESLRQENAREHEAINRSIDNLIKTLGNGGISGLKGEVHDMQVDCANEMGGLRTEIAGVKGQIEALKKDKDG